MFEIIPRSYKAGFCKVGFTTIIFQFLIYKTDVGEGAIRFDLLPDSYKLIPASSSLLQNLFSGSTIFDVIFTIGLSLLVFIAHYYTIQVFKIFPLRGIIKKGYIDKIAIEYSKIESNPDLARLIEDAIPKIFFTIECLDYAMLFFATLAFFLVLIGAYMVSFLLLFSYFITFVILIYVFYVKYLPTLAAVKTLKREIFDV